MAAARPLSADEQRWVEDQLPHTELKALFFSQPPADQRHAHDGARALSTTSGSRPEMIGAALLHDIGKRHATLGAVGRAVATIAARLRIPVGGRLAAYNSHDSVGADELAEVGSEPLVVLFARHHHGDRPASITPADWEALTDVDHKY